MKAILISSLVSFLTALVLVLMPSAEDANAAEYGRVRITKISESGPAPLEPIYDDSDFYQPLMAVDPTKIINIGKQLWHIVQANKSSGKYNPNEVATALPSGVTSAMDLASWLGPRSETYELVYENLLGIDLANMTYTIYFSYGGAYKGKGRYLTNVAIEAVSVSATLGHKFNASARVYPPMNAGTDKDPLAAMQLVLSWNLDGPGGYVEGSASFLVRGDGWLEDLNGLEKYPPK